MDLVSQKKCNGCQSCVQICPVNAINMKKDIYGFEYPYIDKGRCIECGKCNSVCSARKDIIQSEHLRCGAAYSKDSTIKYSGSSGGMFGLFAQNVIMNGGKVYGAAFDTAHRLKTTCAQNKEELQPLYKSKYLLCDTNNSFSRIKQDLEAGIQVLYCSSPCQVWALKLYLGKEYVNLYTIDFVCHGVGSQDLFDKSIKYVERKKNIKIEKYSFRYKRKRSASSHYYWYRALSKNKIKEKSGLYIFDPYYLAYESRLACRDSCYDCHFASENRVSDVTIGDFHNINSYYQEIDRFAGVSMFVCNSQKGLKMFDTLKEKLEIFDMEWDVVKVNNRFQNDECPKIKRAEFLESLKNDKFDTTVKKYLHPSQLWMNILYYYSPKFARVIAFKLFRR